MARKAALVTVLSLVPAEEAGGEAAPAEDEPEELAADEVLVVSKMLLDHFRHSLRMDGIYSLNVSPNSAICTMASKLQHQPVRTIFDNNEPTQLALENIAGWVIEDDSSLVSRTCMWYFRVVHANPSAHNRMHRTSDTLGDCVHHQTVHSPVTL